VKHLYSNVFFYYYLYFIEGFGVKREYIFKQFCLLLTPKLPELPRERTLLESTRIKEKLTIYRHGEYFVPDVV